MTVVGTNRTNYGMGFPDINYQGVSISRGPFSGLPGNLGPTNGFGGLGLAPTQIAEYAVMGLAAWWLWKKYGHKLGL